MSLLRAALVACLAALAALPAGCASSLREQVTPFPPGTPQAVPWTLTRELLTPVTKRILIVVELEQGHPPERAALDQLTRIAARYGERPASWVILGAAGAPLVRFTRDRLELLGPLDGDTSYVFVRFVGEQIDHWGLSYTTRVANRSAYVIVVNQEKHRRFRSLLPERHLEAQTLVHEYGHIIGLPPFDHGYYTMYPEFYDGSHCVNPDCALSKPRMRALLYGLWHVVFLHDYLEDYCAACRAAIAAAKRYWARDKRA